MAEGDGSSRGETAFAELGALELLPPRRRLAPGGVGGDRRRARPRRAGGVRAPRRKRRRRRKLALVEAGSACPGSEDLAPLPSATSVARRGGGSAAAGPWPWSDPQKCRGRRNMIGVAAAGRGRDEASLRSAPRAPRRPGDGPAGGTSSSASPAARRPPRTTTGRRAAPRAPRAGARGRPTAGARVPPGSPRARRARPRQHHQARSRLPMACPAAEPRAVRMLPHAAK